MKRIALIAALAFASQAGWAQDKAAPVAAQPAAQPAPQEPAKPAAPEAKAPAKAAPMKKTSKRNEDARRCLELDGNSAIIKCAEEFL
jgi:hypothetical protein